MQKAISVIDFELTLLETRFIHPERFTKEQTFKSDLYIIPKSKDLGIVALAEIVESLYLSRKVLNNDGKPASKTQIGYLFELMFNVSLEISPTRPAKYTNENHSIELKLLISFVM